MSIRFIHDTHYRRSYGYNEIFYNKITIDRARGEKKNPVLLGD